MPNFEIDHFEFQTNIKMPQFVKIVRYLISLDSVLLILP